MQHRLQMRCHPHGTSPLRCCPESRSAIHKNHPFPQRQLPAITHTMRPHDELHARKLQPKVAGTSCAHLCYDGKLNSPHTLQSFLRSCEHNTPALLNSHTCQPDTSPNCLPAVWQPVAASQHTPTSELPRLAYACTCHTICKHDKPSLKFHMKVLNHLRADANRRKSCESILLIHLLLAVTLYILML